MFMEASDLALSTVFEAIIKSIPKDRCKTCKGETLDGVDPDKPFI
jgi:hypothetical protein